MASRRFVFVYHRIAEPAHDPWNLAVSPARFAEQLQVLRAYGAIMPLGRLLGKPGAGELPPRAIAITFDDGYADNLLSAMPALRRFDVPATIFLCPALLDGSSSFWWDSLTRIIFEPATLPECLELDLGNERIVWDAAACHARSRPVAGDGGRSGAPDRGMRPEEMRRPLYLKLWAVLRRLPHVRQRQALAELSAWTGGPALDDARERPLTRSEAARLAGDGLVEIGAHTLTHVWLPEADPEQKVREIKGSKASCEEIAGARVDGFAYPYGGHDPRTVRLVRDAGFTHAVTTARWPLSRMADRFRLPRIPVSDWDGAEMERRLATLDFD